MFNANLVQHLLKGVDPVHLKTVPLKSGQIFQGRIVKLYPGQLASLQLGGIALTAKLEAALTQGERYWFQVQSGEGIPHLKVIDHNTIRKQTSGTQQSLPMKQLLQQFGLAVSKENEFILQHFSKEEVPFSKEDIRIGGELLTKSGMINKDGITILKTILQKNLPLSLSVFLAVKQTLFGDSISNQLAQLTSILENKSNEDKQFRLLYQQLRQISTEVIITSVETNIENLNKVKGQTNIVQHLHKVIQLIGLNYEHELQQAVGNQRLEEITFERLKPLLLKALQTPIDSSIKQRIESLIHHITGLQLFYSEQHGPLQQYMVQIPLTLGQFQSDLTVQWQGKKNEKGDLDTDHCRIILYLQLEHLQETIIDVQIQNRVVAIQIYNEKERPASMISALQPILQGNLEENGYHLSIVKWTQVTNRPNKTTITKGPQRYQQQALYQGVDVRV
ncbi:hypothetical protein ACJ2A9_08580 [Anaerobacillus sp. MEB173]|uniref:hypothetical protein n=1 Tax=Anaerobacillus sp. MEB173 TaxID=3383345 RepID=UPI003F8DFD63